MRFEDKIKLAMKTRGLDREDLIRLVSAQGQELTRSTLSNYLKGDTRPSLMMGLSLARVLGVSLDYLADDALDAEPARPAGEIEPDERAVLAVFRLQREAEGGKLTPEEAGRRLRQGSYREAGVMLPGRRLGDEGINTGEANPKVAGQSNG